MGKIKVLIVDDKMAVIGKYYELLLMLFVIAMLNNYITSK